MLTALIPSVSNLLGSINLPPIGNTSLSGMIAKASGGLLTLEGGKWVTNTFGGMANKPGVGIAPQPGTAATIRQGLVIDTKTGQVTNPQPLPSWLLPMAIVIGLGIAAYAFFKRRRR